MIGLLDDDLPPRDPAFAGDADAKGPRGLASVRRTYTRCPREHLGEEARGIDATDGTVEPDSDGLDGRRTAVGTRGTVSFRP